MTFWPINQLSKNLFRNLSNSVIIKVYRQFIVETEWQLTFLDQYPKSISKRPRSTKSKRYWSTKLKKSLGYWSTALKNWPFCRRLLFSEVYYITAFHVHPNRQRRTERIFSLVYKSRTICLLSMYAIKKLFRTSVFLVLYIFFL